MKYLVMDVGGSSVKYAVMDEDCNFYVKGKVDVIREPLKAFMDVLYGIYDDTKSYGLSGIALSLPGVIETESGYVHNGGAIICLKGVNIVELLTERTQLKVTVENDAKAAVQSELWRGSLKGCKNAAAIILGTGVGGAVVIDGKVLRGFNLMAGEFSYLLGNFDTKEDHETCLALAAGSESLSKYVAEETGLKSEELNGEKIFALVKKGDLKALNGVRRYCHIIALLIDNLKFIIDPEKIVIGGGISAEPKLIELLNKELETLTTLHPYGIPSPQVSSCAFYNDSNLIGALYVHLKSI